MQCAASDSGDSRQLIQGEIPTDVTSNDIVQREDGFVHPSRRLERIGRIIVHDLRQQSDTLVDRINYRDRKGAVMEPCDRRLATFGLVVFFALRHRLTKSGTLHKRKCTSLS
jgi:hypothetical protein